MEERLKQIIWEQKWIARQLSEIGEERASLVDEWEDLEDERIEILEEE